MRIPPRWILIAVLVLPSALPAGAVTVFGQFDGNTIVIDPLRIDLLGAGYEIRTDLASGTFRARAAYPAGPRSQNAYTGTHSPLILTNNASVPLVFQPGFIAMRVHGTYALGANADSQQSATSSGALAVTIDGVQSVARADHTVSRVVLDNGRVGGESNVFDPAIELNGGRIVPIMASMSEVEYELLMPRLVVHPGQTLSLMLLLAPSAAAFDNGTASADFLNTAELSVRMPRGFPLDALDTDASVPLGFITTVPLPASAWPLLGALALLWYPRTAQFRRRSCILRHRPHLSGTARLGCTRSTFPKAASAPLIWRCGRPACYRPTRKNS